MVRTKGIVQSYEVLRQSGGPTIFEAKVRANIARYNTPGLQPDSRRKLAVLPFSTRARSVQFYGKMSGTELAQGLHQAVLTKFVQSRRFAILDRDSWGAIESERELIASTDTPIAEKAKLGQALGADYLVLGEVLEVAGGTTSRTGSMTGITTTTTSAYLAVAYRIIVPATGQVKYADALDLGLDGHAAASRTVAFNEFAKRVVGIAEDKSSPCRSSA